jgi:predicted PurR-regulated permease PerM
MANDREGELSASVERVQRSIRVPEWLLSAGTAAWLLIGLAVVVLGIVWLLQLTQVIVVPLITAGIVAAVAGPVVSWLKHRGVPRGIGATLVILSLVALAAGVVAIVVVGILSETSQSGDLLTEARSSLTGWAQDLGLSAGSAQDLSDNISSGLSGSISTLLMGAVSGAQAVSSFALFIALALLVLFFLLKDGPALREWSERHMGLPVPLAGTITDRVVGSLRAYFVGVSIVAAFNAAVVAIGAWILGIPLVGTIAAITFVGGFVPFLGAWVAGAFAVLLALGGAGTDAAIAMIVIQILANTLLQQIVQPFAMGAVLGIHPLAVLVVTLAGGALFGTLGLVLAAPLVAAANKVLEDVREARDAAGTAAGGTSGATAAARPTG